MLFWFVKKQAIVLSDPSILYSVCTELHPTKHVFSKCTILLAFRASWTTNACLQVDTRVYDASTYEDDSSNTTHAVALLFSGSFLVWREQ